MQFSVFVISYLELIHYEKIYDFSKLKTVRKYHKNFVMFGTEIFRNLHLHIIIEIALKF